MTSARNIAATDLRPEDHKTNPDDIVPGDRVEFVQYQALRKVRTGTVAVVELTWSGDITVWVDADDVTSAQRVGASIARVRRIIPVPYVEVDQEFMPGDPTPYRISRSVRVF